MSATLRHPDFQVLLTTDRLTAEFHGQVPEYAIRAAVQRARTDLDGQVVPEAMAEMLHRLAHYRLSRWDPGQD